MSLVPFVGLVTLQAVGLSMDEYNEIGGTFSRNN